MLQPRSLSPPRALTNHERATEVCNTMPVEEAAPSPPTRSVACQTTRIQAAPKRAPPSSSDDTEDESDEELVRRPRARHRARLVTRLCRNGCICAVARNPRPFVRFAVEISVCVAIILYVADGLIQKHYDVSLVEITWAVVQFVLP
jgi:hypothetical protein